MNKAILTGRLTRDPEIRVTQDGQTTIARFGLAVDRKQKEQRADFFNLTAFNKTAQFAEKYLKKGTKVNVIGHLQNDEYTNRDGQKVTSTIVIVEEVEFCESKKQEEKTEEKPDGFMKIPDNIDSEELPFNF